MRLKIAVALLVSIVSSAITVLSIAPTHAAIPTVYESISGADGSTLTSTGSSDSLGFTGNWSMINGKKGSTANYAAVYENIYNVALRFPVNSIYTLPAGNTAAGTVANYWRLYYSAREMSSAVNFDSNGNFYLSFLGYSPSPGGNWGSYALGLLNGLPTSSSDTSKNAIFLGRSYGGKPIIQLTTANIAVWDPGTYTAEGSANTPADASGNSWFIVAKFVTAASGNDTVKLKFFASTDTVPASDSAINWDVSYAGPITGTYKYLAPQIEYNAIIDEIRGGATYDAVSGVVISPTIGAASITGNIKKGIASNIVLTVGTPGHVRFFANGKRISNCLKVATTGTAPNYTATCSWKPSVRGSNTITAEFISADPTILNGNALPAKFLVDTRATNR